MLKIVCLDTSCKRETVPWSLLKFFCIVVWFIIEASCMGTCEFLTNFVDIPRVKDLLKNNGKIRAVEDRVAVVQLKMLYTSELCRIFHSIGQT